MADLNFDFLITEIKARKKEMERLEGEIKDLRAEYEDAVFAHGNYHSAVGCIELRKASQRVSFDSRTVEAVMNALQAVSPELAAQLESARKITLVGATWTVK